MAMHFDQRERAIDAARRIDDEKDETIRKRPKAPFSVAETAALAAIGDVLGIDEGGTGEAAHEAPQREETAIGDRRFALGAFVCKKSGASWRGRIVGFYTTKLTPLGCVVESFYEENSCQIYPESALEFWAKMNE